MILLQTETVEIQITKVSVKVMIVKIKNCPRKKGSRQKHKSELKKCSCDFVEGTAEQRLETRIVKTQVEAFSSFINEGMISQIVERRMNR